MDSRPENVDPVELGKFDRLASDWWDPEGPQRALHDLNPLRLGYVAERFELAGSKVLDAGCGAGLLSEALAAAGARVTGLDLSPALLDVAREHAQRGGFPIEYLQCAVESLAEAHPGSFDAITCMEMLEHVPDPASVVAACATLLRPGGRLFVSTINRTPPAFALAIVGAEYVARLLPRGTHTYSRFIRPSELADWLRAAGFDLEDVTGVGYDPLRRRAWARRSTAVNYLACAVRSPV